MYLGQRWDNWDKMPIRKYLLRIDYHIKQLNLMDVYNLSNTIGVFWGMGQVYIFQRFSMCFRPVSGRFSADCPKVLPGLTRCRRGEQRPPAAQAGALVGVVRQWGESCYFTQRDRPFHEA